jgi:hypothetical protein
MKPISPTVHGAIDYLAVVIFAGVPAVIGLSGRSAALSYTLAGIHLLMTFLTVPSLSMCISSPGRTGRGQRNSSNPDVHRQTCSRYPFPGIYPQPRAIDCLGSLGPRLLAIAAST